MSTKNSAVEQRKQITEIGKALSGATFGVNNHHLADYLKKPESIEAIATHLYNVGYRKQMGVEAPSNENCQKQSEWISVDDRLPTEGQNVLCYENGNYYIAFYENRDNVISWWDWVDFDRNDTWNEVCPTHWMPLPEAPKMKGGAKK